MPENNLLKTLLAGAEVLGGAGRKKDEEIQQDEPKISEAEEIEKFNEEYKKIFPNGVQTIPEMQKSDEITKLKDDMANFKSNIGEKLEKSMQELKKYSEKNDAHMVQIAEMLKKTRDAINFNQQELSHDMRDEILQNTSLIKMKYDELDSLRGDYEDMRSRTEKMKAEYEEERVGRTELSALETKQNRYIEELERVREFHENKIRETEKDLDGLLFGYAVLLQNYILNAKDVEKEYIANANQALQKTLR